MRRRDFASPVIRRVAVGRGSVYGTAPEGGSAKCGGGCGVVFELTRQKNGSWSENRPRSFPSVIKGAFPAGNLTGDSSGNTTEGGGLYDSGIIYQLTSSGMENPLRSFVGIPTDGCLPYVGLISGQSNQLFGTTAAGGATNNGAVFQIPE